jgi:nicotinate dehydrogenase subunit B
MSRESHQTAPALRDPARRRLLAAGSLTVSFSLWPAAAALAQQGAQATEAGAPSALDATATKLPGDLSGTPMLDAWIRIDAQGRITAWTGKATSRPR